MYHFSDSDFSSLDGKYLFIDNDFLGVLFSDEKLLESFLNKFNKSFFAVDKFTEFEFLRDVFLPTQLNLKRTFISNEEIFFPVIFHHEVIESVYDNALLLSQLYSHQSQSMKSSKGWSAVDLLLAGRIMYHEKSSFLITGNKKHFPSSIFDTVGVVNIETNDGGMHTFSILKFNRSKLENALVELSKIK